MRRTDASLEFKLHLLFHRHGHRDTQGGQDQTQNSNLCTEGWKEIGEWQNVLRGPGKRRPPAATPLTQKRPRCDGSTDKQARPGPWLGFRAYLVHVSAVLAPTRAPNKHILNRPAKNRCVLQSRMQKAT